MLEAALTAPTGDDVLGEDPTVLELQDYVADLFGKEAGLFVPTGTMSNLTAVLSHCHGRASEIIIGSNSHICLYEGGNAANLGGVHTRQIIEDPDATLPEQAIRDCYRLDNDPHYAKTEVLCLENTHNVMGGAVLPKKYLDRMGDLCHDELNIKLHVDGARICNAVIALNLPPKVLCEKVDSISICLSKGLGEQFIASTWFLEINTQSYQFS
jgi:threonine aldolase